MQFRLSKLCTAVIRFYVFCGAQVGLVALVHAAYVQGAGLAAPAGTNAEMSREVVVAVAGGLSISIDGSASPYGVQMLRGIKLAQADYEESFNEAGLRLRLQRFENSGAANSVAASAHAVMRSQAVAVIGHMFSSEALLAADVYGDSLLFVSPGASAVRLRQQHAKSFRSVALSNLDQAKMILSQVRQNHLQRVGLVAAADCSYCSDLARKIKDLAEGQSLSLQLVLNARVLSEMQDFEDLAQQVRALQVQALILPNYEMLNAKIISAVQHVDAREEVQYFGGDGWGHASQAFYQATDNQTFAGYAIGYWSDALTDSASAALRNRFVSQFGQPPTDAAILAYASARYVFEMILRAHENGDVMRASVLAAAQAEPLPKVNPIEIEYADGRVHSAHRRPL